MELPMPTAEEIYSAAGADGLRPDPLLTISHWADKYRTLSQRASAEPGPWRTDRTPYLSVKNPRQYDGKEITGRATWRYGFEVSDLYCYACWQWCSVLGRV